MFHGEREELTKLELFVKLPSKCFGVRASATFLRSIAVVIPFTFSGLCPVVGISQSCVKWFH